MSRGRARAKRASTSPHRGGDGASVLAALRQLPFEQQRLALILAEALPAVAGDSEVTLSEARNVLSRLVQGGLVQERKAPAARAELAQALGSSLAELDPVPKATVEQARRLAALRTNLLRGGAFSMSALAHARGITPTNARQWVSRHRRAGRVFTAIHEGEALLPAFLLDERLDPRPGATEPIKALRATGEDGWALWAWFAMPSAWVGGRIPADLIDSDPELLAKTARQRAASAA
jgi:hypothetical protein